MDAKNGESSTYGQYCPLALAAELLCRRWSVLIISRLLGGCRNFNDIHRGVPRISPTLLSTRLAELEHAGIVVRRRARGSKRHGYELTEAGRDLNGIIEQMAVWGQYWSRDMNLDDLDPAFLAWSMHIRMNADAMPPGRTVIEFEFSGTPDEFKRFWIVSAGGEVEMCLKNPGFDSDLLVQADLRRFTEAWRGIRDLREEIRRGRIRLSGPPRLKRAFPGWLKLHVLASLPRRAPGRETRLCSRASR